MGEKARWGPMGFVVSPSKVVPFDGFSTSITLKTDNGNDTSGTGATNTRGLDLQPMSFSTRYMRALGVDPRERIESWQAQMGKSYPLYIGNKRFGPAKMMLTKVNVSDLLVNNNGDFLSVRLDFTFQEDRTSSATTTAASSQKANSSSSSKAAETYASTVEKKKAMNATATSSDKADKKANATLGNAKDNSTLSGWL